MNHRLPSPPSLGPNLPKKILCNGRRGVVNTINVSLLFMITAGTTSVLDLQLYDRVREHRFVSGEEPREGEIDGRCQSDLYVTVYVKINWNVESIAKPSEWRAHPEKVRNIE